jgi:hypothetical protein
MKLSYTYGEGIILKFIAYIGAIIFVVTLVLMIKDIRRKDKTNLKRNLIILIISFIVVGVTGKYVPTSTTNKTQPVNNTKKEPVKKETPKPEVKKDTLEQLVAKNFEDGKVIITKETSLLTIQFKVDCTNDNNFVTQMIYNSKRGLEKVYKDDEFKKYNLVMLKGMTGFTDKYGKTTEDVGMRLTFPQSELQKVQSFNDVTNEQFILLQGENKTYLHPAVKKNIKPEILQKVFPNE